VPILLFFKAFAAHVTAGTEKYPKEDEYSLAAENPLILQTPPPVAPGLLVDLAQVDI